MVNLLLRTNLADPQEALLMLREDLCVEKRREPRRLQMSRILS